MPRTSDARQKMIESAAVLFRERGIHGTSFADVLEHSGAPRGSVYHHFKGGKTQITEEALRWAGELMAADIADALQQYEPVEALGAWSEQWAALLRDTDYAAGCSIVAATQDGAHEPAARSVAGSVFADWQAVIAGALAGQDVPQARATSLAALLVAAIEGAVVLARAQSDLAPLRLVTTELQRVLSTALPDTAKGDVAH
jgi:TetR/AcrR family transcriptional regulator, lmrAB and yxaGH operons repressor